MTMAEKVTTEEFAEVKEQLEWCKLRIEELESRGPAGEVAKFKLQLLEGIEAKINDPSGLIAHMRGLEDLHEIVDATEG